MFARLREQQVHHTRGRSGVQVAGGFIGQQQGGAVHQGARNGHALQLATAQLLGQALAQVGQAHGCQHVLHPIGFGAAQQHERQGYVLRHAEVGQHMKGLKHKPHMGAPPQGALRFIQRRQVGVATTIQALEVQKMTLATLKGMNFNMGDVANAFKLKAADTVMSGLHKAAGAASSVSDVLRPAAAPAAAPEPAVAPAPEPAPAPAPKAEARKPAKGSKAAAKAAPGGIVDPLQWWGALTEQFQHIAATAVKDAARQTAVDTTRNMATGVAKEMVKTAKAATKSVARKAAPRKTGGAAAKKATPTRSKPKN